MVDENIESEKYPGTNESELEQEMNKIISEYFSQSDAEIDRQIQDYQMLQQMREHIYFMTNMKAHKENSIGVEGEELDLVELQVDGKKKTVDTTQVVTGGEKQNLESSNKGAVGKKNVYGCPCTLR